ncbi:haloacid dehalogenase type II [Gemmatimonas sp.]|uniref:haloacid dehalogenase type II n=1 Tax=Gemmatimonas sp. TaxID=1962908 RepID=UPI003983ADB7
MKPVLVFDMNETLLDLSSLDPTFARLFGLSEGSALRKTWFTLVGALFLTSTITDEYRSFDKLTDDALQMLAMQLGREASANDRTALREAQGSISAYADVAPGLTQLKASGFTLATLTNSTTKAAEHLLGLSGIRQRFDAVLSADTIGRYKPAREAYAYAARELGVNPERIVLVAAHAWDVAGAMAAGLQAAFISRPGQVMSPGQPKPQYEAADIAVLANQLVAQHG